MTEVPEAARAANTQATFYVRGEALAHAAHALCGPQEAYVIALLRPSLGGKTIDAVAFYSDNLAHPLDALDIIRETINDGTSTTIDPNIGHA